MPLRFGDMIGMVMRNVPIKKIRHALALAEQAKLAISARDLEAHHLCGKDPVALVEGLVTAHQIGVQTSFQELSVIALAGHQLPEIVLQSSKEKTTSFDTYSTQGVDPIRGFTKDRIELTAEISVRYSLTPTQVAFGFNFLPLQQRLSSAVSVLINTATNLRSLQLSKNHHEAELAAVGAEILKGIKSVSVTYR